MAHGPGQVALSTAPEIRLAGVSAPASAAKASIVTARATVRAGIISCHHRPEKSVLQWPVRTEVFWPAPD